MRALIVAGLLLLSAPLEAQTTTQPPAASAETDSRPSFADWLSGVRTEALSRGIRAETVERALSDIPEPLPVVIERDRSQAETVLPLETYISRRLTATLIRRGRDMMDRHRAMLDRVAADYGVPARIIAGIWGVESNFGAFSGTRPIIPALATLAFDPRRATLFRRELFSALEIIDRGDIEDTRLRGSWAGAMGQPQFMPSSYLAYAVDYDGDGRRDIWSSPDDVFASIANYLRGHGWKSGQPWVREVKVSKTVATRIAADVARRAGSCGARRDMTVALPLDAWTSLGVRTVAGGTLPRSALSASLVAGASRSFLVFDNYDALLEYNCAHAYALTVVLLGERLGGAAPDARARAENRPAPIMSTLDTDDRGLLVVCPSCGQKNRLAFERLSDTVRCGRCKTTLAATQPLEAETTPDFDRLVSASSIPVVVDYWAPWCGPCRMVAPELEKVAARANGRYLVVKVNTDLLSDLGERFAIRSIPTMAVFSGGREIARTTGARPAADIEAFIISSQPK